MRCKLSATIFFMTFLAVFNSGKADVQHQDHGLLSMSSRILSYQGYVTDSLGVPVNNDSLVTTFAIYDSLTGGHLLWVETQNIDIKHGIFHAILGLVSSLPDTLFQKGTTYGLQMTIDGQSLATRTRVNSVSYALSAITADTANYAVQADDDDWYRGSSSQDSILFTVRPLGIAKGASNNILYGTARYTHTNLGAACTTGISGYNYPYVTVTGGFRNIAGDTAATISGGYRNQALGRYSTVTGGGYHYADGDYSVIMGGDGDTVNATYGGVLSGYSNRAGDSPLDTCAVVAGGLDNSAWEKFSWIGGGRSNTALNFYATVPGGYANSAWGQFSTVAGGQNNLAFQHFSTIFGGFGDTVRSVYGGIIGGQSNLAGQSAVDTSAICMGGYNNSALFLYSFIGGGRDNWTNDIYATVIGGYGNQAIDNYTTIIGGYNNAANADYAAVGGGINNSATANYSTIIGGYANAATGLYSSVAGGYLDTVAGAYGFAAGNSSVVPSAYTNSTAFNGQTVTATGETHVGILSKAGGTFTIDHPLDPDTKILNHYFVESPDMTTMYRGTAVLDQNGQAEIFLPVYFDILNRRPLIQISASGAGDAYILEKVSGNRFMIGGTPGAEVSWIVTGQRRDPTAEITRVMMPVEQVKEGDLAGHYLDDDLLRATRSKLIKMGVVDRFKYRSETSSEVKSGGR
ncbi:MAG TPA: hypothetical protein VF399_02990 [bacterium]